MIKRNRESRLPKIKSTKDLDVEKVCVVDDYAK